MDSLFFYLDAVLLVSEPPGGEFPAEGFHVAFALGETTSCVSICALPILDCGVVRPGVSIVSVDFLLIIHIKGNDKGDHLHVDVLVEIGMHPCGFPIPDRDVVPAYMFGILRAESGEVGGEVLPETAVKRRFASKQARCRRRKFGIEAEVDRQRLDRLLDSRDSALISCFFSLHMRFMIFTESSSTTCLAFRMPAPPIMLEERRMQPRIKTINLVWMDFIFMPPRVRFAARRLKDIRVSCWGNPAASGFLEHDSGRQSLAWRII